MVAGPWPMHYFMISSPISWALHLGNIISPYTQWWGMGTKLTPCLQRTGQVTIPNVKWRGWGCVAVYQSVCSPVYLQSVVRRKWVLPEVVILLGPGPGLCNMSRPPHCSWLLLLYPGLQHEMGTGIILTYRHQGKLGTMLWRLHSFLKLHTS